MFSGVQPKSFNELIRCVRNGPRSCARPLKSKLMRDVNIAFGLANFLRMLALALRSAGVFFCFVDVAFRAVLSPRNCVHVGYPSSSRCIGKQYLNDLWPFLRFQLCPQIGFNVWAISCCVMSSTLKLPSLGRTCSCSGLNQRALTHCF